MRLVLRLSNIVHTLEDSKKTFDSSAISATSVRHQLGTRYGCLTAILDILKGLLPTLAFRLWQPDAPYYLITAAMTTLGHNYPLYHGFKGGRGLSTIMGGLFVLDWAGVLLTNIAGTLLGMIAGTSGAYTLGRTPVDDPVGLVPHL